MLPGRMNSAPISTTAPFGSVCDHTRPPTRDARLEHDDLRAARCQLVRGDEPGEPGADDDGPHPATGIGRDGVDGGRAVLVHEHRVQLEQLEPGSQEQLARRDGEPGGRRHVQRQRAPRPPVSSGAARSPRIAASTRSGAAGSGTTAASSSTSVQAPPARDHEARHHGIGARGDEQLGAGRRHALDEHPGSLRRQRGRAAGARRAGPPRSRRRAPAHRCRPCVAPTARCSFTAT